MRIKRNKRSVLAFGLCALFVVGASAAVLSNILSITTTLDATAPITLSWAASPDSSELIIGESRDYILKATCGELDGMTLAIVFVVSIEGPVGFNASEHIEVRVGAGGTGTPIVPIDGFYQFAASDIITAEVLTKACSIVFLWGAPSGDYTYNFSCIGDWSVP